MKGRILGAILGTTGFISLASLGAILLFIPPETEPVLAPTLFSLALFLALASGLSFAGLRLRRRYETPATKERILAISFREAIILGLVALSFLWLNRLGGLTVWSAVGLLVVAAVFEYIFLLRRAQAQISN